MAKQGVKTFTDDEVRSIRNSPASPREIARFYGCSTESIRRVIRRETYFGVPDTPQVSQSEVDASLAKIMDELTRVEGEREGESSTPAASTHDCPGEGCMICAQINAYTGRKGNPQ